MQHDRPERRTAGPTARPAGWSEMLTCPACGQPRCLVSRHLKRGTEDLQCSRCGSTVSLMEGIPNLAPHVMPQDEQHPWKQKVMDSPVFARLYETRGWRPFHAYVASHGSLEQEINDVLALAQGTPVQVAVDLACGTGLYAREMARRNPAATVLGIDISPGMLVRAQTLAQKAGLQHLHSS